MIILYSASILFILLLSLLAVFSYHIPSATKIFKSNSVAIVIPFRNEASRIQLLLDSLLKIKDFNIPVVLVNDHSTDNSQDIIQSFLHTHSLNFVRILNLPSDLKGKKQAQQYAVLQLKVDWIYFADADTELAPKLIEFLLSIPASSSLKFVQGFPIFYSVKPNFLFHILYLEFLTLVGIGFITRFYRFPILANGAIMAMKREIYLELNLREDLASGDDMFALREILRKYGVKSIHYAPFVVRTNAPRSFSESIQQKKRWISKWAWTDYLAAIIALILFYSGPVIALYNKQYFFEILCLMPIALTLLILSLMRLTQNYKSILNLPLVILILPIYLGLVVSLVQKSKPSWKNRPI